MPALPGRERVRASCNAGSLTKPATLTRRSHPFTKQGRNPRHEKTTNAPSLQGIGPKATAPQKQDTLRAKTRGCYMIQQPRKGAKAVRAAFTLRLISPFLSLGFSVPLWKKKQWEMIVLTGRKSTARPASPPTVMGNAKKSLLRVSCGAHRTLPCVLWTGGSLSSANITHAPNLPLTSVS